MGTDRTISFRISTSAHYKEITTQEYQKREREKNKKEILQKNQCAKTHHITFMSHATRDGLLELGVHDFQRNYVIQKKKRSSKEWSKPRLVSKINCSRE